MAGRRLKRHLSQDEMNRGIGMLHSGLSQRHVANVLGVSQSVVSRMWNRIITTGNVRHLHAGGRERSTNEVQDRFLVVQARRHRFDNEAVISNFAEAIVLIFSCFSALDVDFFTLYLPIILRNPVKSATPSIAMTVGAAITVDNKATPPAPPTMVIVIKNRIHVVDYSCCSKILFT